MIKFIHPQLFCFDIEWIPDPHTARILHGQDLTTSDAVQESYEALWKAAGATEESPQPYLKTILCRIVSVSGIYREAAGGKVDLKLISLPRDVSNPDQCRERHILSSLLKAIGGKKPQLVGFNSANADVPIIAQRSVVNGLSSHGVGQRPDKPWEGVDYFSQHSDYHIDLSPMLGRYQQTPSLHEAASLSGIPGKVDVSGGTVPELWKNGEWDHIIAYNEFDAFTTYLLWARVAHFCDLLNERAYEYEQEKVRELLESEIDSGKEHLVRYVEEWDRLQELIAERDQSHLR